MTLPYRSPRTAGFSLIELMVTIAIIAIGVTLAVPYFGGATTMARERSVMDKMVQDFNWSRVAAGVADAGTLAVTGAAGTPTVTLKLEAQATNCSWTTKVNGVTDPVHSMTQAQMATLAPGITCGVTADTLALPITFTFNAQGMVDQSGTVTYSSTQAGSTSSKFWPLLFLTSGAIINTNAVP